MNYKMVRYTLGILLLFEAFFFIVPIITALYYNEMKALDSFIITAVICIVLAAPFIIKKPKNSELFAKEGFVIVSLSWILLSIFGALPLVISGDVPNFIDAFFEMVSGFTTTGSSIIPAVEEMTHATLIWRSFSNWIGGMGVLVFIMAFLPLGGAQNLHIMRAESPGPSVSKLVPRMRSTALILYLIYFVFTAFMFVTLLFDPGTDAANGKMTVFEALNTAFATAGTGLRL